MDNLKKDYEYGFYDKNDSVFSLPKGHSVETVKKISEMKNEPKWMLDIRLESYESFLKHDLPKFGPDLSFINFDDVIYYSKATNGVVNNWDEVPDKIRKTFDKLGISKEEQEWLGGLSTQYDSEVIYSNSIEKLTKKGVIFCSTDEAVQKYPDIVKSHFGKIVKKESNMLAALNGAFWSGGTFIFVPKGVKLDMPIQSYFRINERGVGQFERTMIIVEDDAVLDYIEGCTAPTYTTDSLHAAGVEVFVGERAKCKYTTIQNWSDNVLNLVTKSSIVETSGSMEWIDGNLGSKINMKYPSTILKGDNSSGLCLSIAVAIGDTIQDSGAKMIHIGKNTKSTILAKSISGMKGKVNYRGLVLQTPTATNSKSKIECDTMILDDESTSDTIPDNIVQNKSSIIEHEASVSKISEIEIYYLMSRGLTRDQARETIIMGFLDEFTKSIPLEYASELNTLIQMEFDTNLG